MDNVQKTGRLESPLVSVVVLNYNGREHLEYCLSSIAETDYPNFHTIVVDNASTDGSVTLVTDLYPWVQLILSDVNRGWSGGNNLGIWAAIQKGAEYIVLANSDIRVDPRWLRSAVDVAEGNPRVGVVGFHVFEPELGSADRDAGFDAACAGWETVGISFPKYVGGMAMFVRAEVFERIGMIDEGFFAYGEENDFQIRARKAGYSIAAINLPVWHYGQGSFGAIPVRAAILQTRNNIRLLIKHSSPQEVIAAGVRHLLNRCLSAKGVPVQNPVERRLQRFGFPANLFILLYAVLVNILQLPLTLKRRREDERRARAAGVLWNDNKGGLD